MEKLHNQYLKIAPIPNESFIYSENKIYKEIGIVLLKDESLTNIEIGDKVIFDPYLAIKIPVEGKDEEFEWYARYSEIISSTQ